MVELEVNIVISTVGYWKRASSIDKVIVPKEHLSDHLKLHNKASVR